MKRLLAPARACALVMALMLVLFTSYFRHTSSAVAIAQSVPPSGAINELAIDDGVAECVLGAPAPLRGTPGFGWVNKLTPASYPATLRAITIGFNRNGPVGRAVARDALYRIVVYLDPEKDGPGNNQPPDAAFIGRVRDDFQSIMTFNLVTPLTIQSGSFVVGAIDEFGIADFAALYDVPGKSTPPGSESFVTFNNGGAWQKLSDAPFQGTSFCDHPGSFLIRATVESGPVDALTVTKITDPLAVEPWGVGGNFNMVVVTNYASDNLTVIKTADNTFQNIPVGDGPGGEPDGPFGVIAGTFVIGGDVIADRAYVTLFGSNTIPTKEFPVDYSTVGPGRVVVLARNAGGLAPALTINVGKGPRFPAFVVSAGVRKIYVPCGGANRVDVIDTNRNEKVAEIPVGLDPSSCVASINGAKIYVTNFGDGSVSVIDTKTDKKIKDIPAPRVLIPAPIGSTAPPVSPLLTNPWNAALSLANGNIYVTYWGTEGNVFPNGAIAEFDTCKDEFVRATLDNTTRGTPPGSAGASGIDAPAAPLTLDPATGKTPGAGGGGGGPFGIASCETDPLVFTNDALGIVGLLDSSIDQIVSAPPVALSSCPKPRGVICLLIARVPQMVSRAYVACGQPDNSVLVFNVPKITQSISGLPVIESVKIGSKVEIRGTGFAPGTKLEFIPTGSLACLSFERDANIKKQGKLLQQKGSLTDGTKLKGRSGFLRVISPDGTIRLIDLRSLIVVSTN